MKNCFRIPRIMLPRENYEYWAVPPVDLMSKARCEEFTTYAGDRPSLLPCVVPDWETDDFEERVSFMQKTNAKYLRDGRFERLYRGAIYVERETQRGLRRGVVACLDLESFSLSDPPVRFSTKVESFLLKRRTMARREAMLEFPHTVLLYRDKKDKAMRLVGDDREKLYDFSLPLGGGKVAGYFIPNEDAEHLMREIVSRADPFFVVADGNHTLSAAKYYWEEVSAALSEEEKMLHPARFTLVEFVNAAQESVELSPLHRVVSEIETEAFCDYFLRNIKCKREGNVLYPILTGPESYCEANDVISSFIKQNYGVLTRTLQGPKAYVDSKDTAFVAFPAVGKDELFSALKGGKKFPAKTFCLGAETDARFSFEGREITYD